MIKMRQALEIMTPAGQTKQAQLRHKEEIEAYLSYAQQVDAEQKLGNVYVTNHEQKQKRYHTNSTEEDQQFYRYMQSVEEYKKSSAPKLTAVPASAEEFDGPTFDFSSLNLEEGQEMTPELELEIKTIIIKELQGQFTPDELNALMDKHLSVFKEGQKYDFSKDLKNAFSSTLSKSLAEQILETVPDHAFWDIKKPASLEEDKIMNPYNPFRKYPFESFFDMRENEEYNDRRYFKRNLRDNVSTYRRY